MHSLLIDSTVAEFLSCISDKNTLGRTLETYSRKIRVFRLYVVETLQPNDLTCEIILQKFSFERLLDSIEYYVNLGGIRYKTTIDNYVTVICLYFDFIAKKGIINDFFNNVSERAKLNELVGELCEKLKLNSKQQIDAITSEEAYRLIELCNEKLNGNNHAEIAQSGYNSDFTFYISALITKLVLFSGAKNNVVVALKLSDYNPDLNQIRINGYWLQLPNELALQMKEYCERVRTRMLQTEEHITILFINNNPENRKLENGKMFEIVKDICGKKSAVAVAKFAIIEMIKKGISPNHIMSLTGFSEDVYGYCQEFVDQIEEYHETRNVNRYLNSKLRDIELFDLL